MKENKNIVNALFNTETDNKEITVETKNGSNIDLNETSQVDKQQKENLDKNIKKESSTISKEEFEKVKEQLDKNKKWGHETAQTYSLAKKRLKELAEKWTEDDIIYEEDKESLMAIFDKEILNENNSEEDIVEKNNSDEVLIKKLNSESENYIKYNKGKNVEEDLIGFYKSFDHFTSEQKKDIKEYLIEADSVDALERAVSIGNDYNSFIEKGIKKHGDFIKYVKYLQNENDKLQNKLKDTSKKLDSSYGNVENSNITSRYSGSINSKPEDKKGEIVKALFG